MSRSRKTLLSILVLVLVVNAAIWLTGVSYVYKALWYFTADIDDYKIFENRIITAGNYKPLPVAANYNKKEIPPQLTKTLESIETVSFLVLKNDSIIYERYWHGYTDTSISNSFSMAKTIVSMLTGIALTEGKIKSLDQPVSDFLPEFKEGEKATITIKHLLTMTSGLNWEETYISPISHTTEAYYGNDLQKAISKLKVIHKPGSLFSYKSGDTQILAFALEKAIGKNISEYVSEKLWKPIGAKYDAIWSLDNEKGMEKAYCCFNATARDFARLGLLYLNKGNWNGTEIVPVEYVNASISPILTRNVEGNLTDYYGYGWWLMPERKAFYARGILGQYIIILPEQDLVIVRLGKKRGEKKGEHYTETVEIIEQISRTFR